jgi:hypothetical protein
VVPASIEINGSSGSAACFPRAAGLSETAYVFSTEALSL